MLYGHGFCMSWFNGHEFANVYNGHEFSKHDVLVVSLVPMISRYIQCTPPCLRDCIIVNTIDCGRLIQFIKHMHTFLSFAKHTGCSELRVSYK